MAVHYFTVPEEYDGVKLESFLKSHCNVSTTTIRVARRNENGLTIDDKHIRTIDPVYAGGTVKMDTGVETKEYLETDLEIPVAYEDENIIVFDKPFGMTCHPSKGHPFDTVANVFASHPTTKGLTFRCIGRLDSNTSGLVAVAKSAHASHTIFGNTPKRYLAVVCGELPSGVHSINAPISHPEFGNPQRAVGEDGKEAVTHFLTLLSNEKYSLCSLWLETGRTHQIRVHMKHFGFVLAGDELYGADRIHINRHALHCYIMDIPTENGYETAFSPLPSDIEKLLLTCYSPQEMEKAICQGKNFVIQ